MRPGRRAARVRLAAAATAAWFGIGGAVSLYDSRPADANPAGGQVTAGTATIATPTPTVETINQSTQRAVIDWKSFNIAVGEKTQFVQPSASAMTLNRVLAADPSTIAGQLIANGSIVLVNPSGVVFSKGSQVNVNSIIATPTNISNSNFMAGNLKFDQPSPNPNASIVNAGTITVGERGLAALVAPSVVNSGVIQARLGKVVLGGAETYAIDLYGDGLISFDVGSNVQIVPLGPDGKPVSSLVSNLGQIAAAGGTVLLTADAAAGILASVIDSPGKISASTITSPKGVVTVGDVTLDAGAGNGAQLSGSIDVSGHRPGQTGGSAIVTGGAVELTRTASIKASGPAGGGTVAIGGGPHGQSPAIRNADSTTVETGALIDASATANGNGGTVSVWSDGTTVFNGAILAKGGPGGGDGGWVETSGHNLAIGAAATVTASAPAGKSGTWLLDPFNVEITDTTDGNSTSNAAGGTTTFSPTATGAQVAASSIVTALDTNNTNVVVTTSGGGGEAGDITVNGAITWISAHSLTLNADGSIAINATITGSNAGSGLVLTASAGSITIGSPLFVSGQISLNADVMSFGAQVGGSSLNTGVATNVTLAPATAGAAINVGVGSGGLALSPTDLQNDVFAATLVIGNSNTGKVSILSALDFTGAHVTNLTVDPAFAVLGADISTPGGQTYPDPVVLGANVTLTSTGGGNISFGGTLDSGTAAGTFGLTATTGGEVLFGGNVGTTTDVTTGAAGALKFLDATGSGGQGIIIDANVQTGTGNQTYHNAVALGGAAETLTTGGGAITFSGTIDGASPLTIAAGSGAITFGGDVGTGTPLSSLSATGQFGTITNAITTSGTLALFDTATATSLNIQSAALTSTAGQVFLQSADTTDGVQISGPGGVVTGMTVSVQADALALTGGGTIDAGAGTFEFAPKSSIAMGLGTGGLFTSTAGITAGTFRLGAVAVPGSGLTTTASSIAVASTVAFGGANLELDTTGTIDDGGVGQVTGVGTLTGTSSGGTTLNQSNQIATLGNFTNTGAGGFQLITATAPLTQTVGTTIDGGSGTIAINTTVQTFTQSGTLTTTNSGGSAVVLADIGTLTIGTITAASGEVALGTIGHTVGTVTETGTITASELAVESTSSVTLGQANVVSQLGTVTASGNFVFDNTAALEVLSGATVNAGAGTILIDNGGTALTLDATSLVETTATGSAVTLQNTAALGTNGAITASSGTVVLGTAGNTVGATVGAGTEVITADTLTGVSTGGVVLTGANAIANLGPYTPGGAFGLIEATNLTVNGTMSAGGSDVSLFLNRNPGLALTVSSPIFSTGQISLQADAMTFGAQIGGSGLGAGQASLVGVASATNPVNISLGGSATNGPGLLGLSAAELNEIHATDVKIVNVNGAINFDGAFTASPAFGTDLGTASPLATNGLYLLTGATGTIEIGGVLTLNGGLSALDTNITLNQSISTPGVQFYAGRIILGSSVTLSTANQLIDLDATIDATTSGAQGLTVNAGTGTVTFGAAVGTTALSTLSATGGAVQLNGGSVTTNGGGQSYTGPVTLGVGAILADTGGGNIALNGAVDGIRLTVNTLGTTTFGGAVGGTTPLASLTTDAGGATDLNGGTVHTTGAQTYSDAVMLGATTTLTSDISSSLTSAVTLASTVDGPFALTVNTSGQTEFDGAIGAINPLASLTTDAGGRTNLAAGTVKTTGAQTYNDSTDLLATTVLTSTGSGNITFATALLGGNDLTVSTAGTAIFGGTVSENSLNVSNASGSATIDANISTSGAQNYAGTATLGGAAITLNSTSGGANGAITFAGQVTGGGDSLTLTSGTGAVTLAGVDVGSAGNLAFTGTTGMLTLNGGTYTIAGSYAFPTATANGTLVLGDTGTTTFGALTLGSTATFRSGTPGGNNGGITFGAIDGQQMLTIDAGTGNVTLGGSVGNQFTPTSLQVNFGTLAINGGAVTTAGTQTYTATPGATDLVTLGSASTTLSTTNSLISFNSPISGSGDALTLTTGSGGLTLNGATLGSLVMNTTGPISLGGAVYDIDSPLSFPDAPTTLSGTTTLDSATTFAGPVTLTGNTTIDTGVNGIVFNNTITGQSAGGQSLTITGNGLVTFNGAIGGGGTPLASLTVSDPVINADMTTVGAQTYSTAVTLGTGTTPATFVLTTTNSPVSFGSTVDAATAGDQGLTVAAGTGAVTFGGPVGSQQALASLNVTGPTAIQANVISTGAQTYNSAVTLGVGATPATIALSTTNAAVDFVDRVDAATLQDQGLTVNAGAGTVTFGGAVGGLASLASLATTGGQVVIGGGQIMTAGAQAYTGSTGGIVLGAGTVLAASNSAISLNSPVTSLSVGGDALVLTNGSGGVTLDGATVASLTLTTIGPLSLGGNTYDIGDGTVPYTFPAVATSLNGTFSLGQPTIFNGGVTLGATTTLNTAANLTFNNAIDGNQDLTINAGAGLVTFNSEIGGLMPLASLTVSDPVLNAAVTTVGAQTYNSAVTLGTGITPTTILLTTTNAAVDFASTVDAATAGDQGLTVAVGTGTVTFGGAVGGGQKLATLTVTGGTIASNGAVATTGAQSYTNSAQLDLNGGTYTATNGAFTENGATTLGANTTIDTSAGPNNITFQTGGAITGTAFTLTMKAGTSTIALNGPVSTASQSYTDGNLDLNGGSYTAGGGFTESGLAVLGAPSTTIDTSTGNGPILFQGNGTIDGASALAMTSGTGAITVSGAIGGSAVLTSVTASGGVITLGNSTNTTGAQSYTDTTLKLAGPNYTTANGTFTETGATVLTGGTTIDTSAGNQAILFQGSGTIDGPVALGMSSGTGAITVGTIGGGAALGSVTASGGVITLGGSANTTGAQSYTDTTLKLAGPNYTTANGTFTETGATMLTVDTRIDTSAGPGAILFQGGGAIDGGFALALNSGTAATTVGGNVGVATPLASLTATGGTITLGGNAITTGAQGYTDTTLNLAGTMYETNANPTPAATFNQTGATNYTAGNVTIDTTGVGTSPAGANIGFVGSINGNGALAMNAGAIGTITLDGSVASGAGSQGYTDATLDLNGAIYTAGAGFTENGATVLTDDVTVNTLAGNGPILFQGAGTIDGDGVAGRNLTLTAGSGAITVGGAVGGNVPLATLMASGGVITVGGSASTTGFQIYTDTTLKLAGPNYTTANGTFTETGATMLTGGASIDTSAGNQAILFQTGGTIDGGFALTLNSGTAATTVGGDIGATTPLAMLTANGGTITLGGNAITTGAQGYTDTTLNLAGTIYETNASPTPAATFNQTGATNYTAGSVRIDATGVGTSPAGANIGFVGSINGNGALAMNAGTAGTITLDGAVASGVGSQGYTDATLDLNGATYTAGAGFTENGATVLTDDVTVNTLAGNGPILFQGAGTIDGDGVAGRNLTLTAGSGAITVGAPLVGGTGGAVGGTVALATLTATTTGTITLDGSVTTTGAQTYSDTTLDLNGPNYTTKTSGAFTETGATQLTNNVTIDTSAGSQNIAFQLPVGTIDGAFGLTLNAGTGAVTVAGNIGGVTPLASLSVMGGMVTFGGGVTTTAGPVTVHDGSALQLPNVTTAGLLSVFAGGALTQGPGTAITAGSLEAVTELTAGAPITLSSPTNLIPGTVTLSALNTAGTATAPGAITFVDNSGFTVAPIALGGLNGQEKGVVNDPAPIYLTVDKAGATFTNDGAIDSTGGVPALGSDILILADLMNLHAGSPSTINAGNARVVLGPFTQSPSQTITLQGTGGTAGGGLNLTNADLGTITSGLLQIGSSSATYSNGAITVSGAVVVPSTSATLALVSSGDIADASGAETLSVTNLALNAGGKIHLKGANPVSMLAGQSAGGDFDFLDGSALLTVGTVPTTDPIAAIGIAASSGSLTNAALTPIVGITSSGAVNLTATGSVTIATPISAGTTVAIQDSGALAINSPVASSTVAGGLEAEFFSDQLTIGAPVTFGSGLVLLAPNTLSRGIDLGGSSATALELTNASLNEITAKIIQIGYTNAFNGSITVSGPIHLAATQELGLLTGTFGGTSGSISESTGTPAGTITTGSLALSAAGSVSMPNANSVGVIAGQAGGSFMFRDDSTTLTIGAVGNLVSGPAGIDPDFLGVATANGNIILEATTSGNLVLADPVNAGSMAVALGSAGTITQTGAGLLTGAALETVSSDYTELGLANTIGTSGAAGTLAGRVLTAGRSYLVNDTLAGGLTVGTVNVVDTNGVTLLNPTTPAVFVAQPVSGVATQDGAILIEATGNLALSQPVDAGLDFTPTTALALASPLKLAAAPAAIGLSSGGQITQSGSGILVGGAVETVSVNSTELGLANLVGNAGGAGTPGMLAGTVSTAGQSFLFRDDSNSLTVGTLNVSSTPGTLFQPTALSGVKTNNGNLLIEATTSGNLLLTQAVDAGTMAVALGSAGTITQSGPGLLSGTALETVSSGYTELGLANTIGTAGGAGTVAGRVLTAGQSYLVDDASAGGLTVGAATVADTNNVTLLNPTTPAVSVSLPLSGVATQDGAILIEAAGNLAFTQAADAALDFAPATALALASPPTLSAAPGSIALISGGQITQTGSGILVGAAVETVSATSTELGLANLVGNAGGTGTPGMLAGTVSTAAQSFLFRDDSNSLTVGTLNVSSTPGTLFQPTALSGVTTKNGSLLIETTTSGNLLLTQAVNAGSGSVALGSAGTITQNAVAGSITGANLEILSQERVSLGTPADPATNTIGTSSASGVLAAQIVNSGESLVVADGAAQGMTLGSLDVVDTGGLRLIDQRATPAALLTGGLSGATTNNANIALRTTAGPLALAASIGAGAGSVGLESTASTISQTAGTITATVLEANSAGAVSLPDGNAVANLAGQVTGSGSFIFVDQTSLAIDPVAAVLEQGTGASSPGAPMLTIAGLSQISAPGDVEVTTKGAATLSGTYSLTGTRVALSASGNFTQTGSTTVTADYLLVDTTGLGAAALVADVPTPTMALASVATEPGLGPHGASNTMNFNGTVSAAGTQTVLFGGHGTVDSVSGGLLVKGLLVSGAGGSAGLFGSIGGIATSTAAQEGLINPSSSNNYRFNTCVIGSVSCILLPALIPVEPQAATQIDILVARPAVEDLDAPLVDIFDEQRLCEQLLRTDPKRAREYCQ